MFKINCETKDTIKLVDITPFQGNLKKRTDQDINELRDSLLNEGLMMPFAIWQNEGKNFLLDGHGRLKAIMSMSDPEAFNADYPCIMIKADTENDARKALLQITSSYGKITKQGVKQFCVSIPDYKAPSIKKFVSAPVKTTPKATVQTEGKVVIKVKVDKDKVEQVKEILRQFDYLEVL